MKILPRGKKPELIRREASRSSPRHPIRNEPDRSLKVTDKGTFGGSIRSVCLAEFFFGHELVEFGGRAEGGEGLVAEDFFAIREAFIEGLAEILNCFVILA